MAVIISTVLRHTVVKSTVVPYCPSLLDLTAEKSWLPANSHTICGFCVFSTVFIRSATAWNCLSASSALMCPLLPSAPSRANLIMAPKAESFSMCFAVTRFTGLPSSINDSLPVFLSCATSMPAVTVN